ncbi:MAG: hypothetical protein QM817_33425 [Archangium sp.]
MATVALAFGIITALISVVCALLGIARRGNGGFLGFVAVIASLVGGVLTLILAILSLITSADHTLGFVALGLALGSPVCAVLLVLFFMPKSAFRL